MFFMLLLFILLRGQRMVSHRSLDWVRQGFYFPAVENRKNTISNSNSDILICSRQQSLENYYLQNFISIYMYYQQ